MEALSKSKIKWIRSLKMKKFRDSEGCFVVEGHKMVMELIQNHPRSIELICTTDKEFNDWNGAFYITEKELKSVSGLKNPNQCLAVVRKPVVPEQKASFILALDGIQDPGNFGTIIRTADWFGVDQIICSTNSVDCFNPKVVQSTMGSLFRIPINYVDLSEYLSQQELPIYGALLDGTPLNQVALQPQGILVMGNEGNGISDDVKSLLTHPIFIPKFGGAESLNVSIATGILLAEFRK